MEQTDRWNKRGIDRMERMENQKKKRKERRRELAIGRGWKRAVGGKYEIRSGRDHLASLRFFPRLPTPSRGLSLLARYPYRDQTARERSRVARRVRDWSRGGLVYPHYVPQTPPVPHYLLRASSRHYIGRPIALSFRLGAC